MIQTDNQGNAQNINFNLEKNPSMRAIWLWEREEVTFAEINDPNTLDALIKDDINTIFLVLKGQNDDVTDPAKYYGFVEYAHQNDIKVYADILGITEEKYSDLYNQKRLREYALEEVKNVLDSRVPFDGIVVDLEPHTAPEFNIDDKRYSEKKQVEMLQDYKQTIEGISQIINGKIKLAACIPVSQKVKIQEQWYDYYIPSLASNLDFFVIMAYDGPTLRNNKPEIEACTSDIIRMISGAGSQYVIGIGSHEKFESQKSLKMLREELIVDRLNDPLFMGTSIWDYRIYYKLAFPCCSSLQTSGLIPT
jgi:hypothetical protein